MCIHCVRVSLNPMTGVIIYISVKRFERAIGLEKRYIRTSYYGAPAILLVILVLF